MSRFLASADSKTWFVDTSKCFACGRDGKADLGVITAGDDVRLATLDDVRVAVSPIETRDEAAAILLLQNGYVDCNTENNVRPEGDGWVFKVTSSSCNGSKSETFTKIARDGTMSKAGTHKISDADDGCIEGRRPAGLVPTRSPWLSSVGLCLAEIAHMEAAAVHAFAEVAQRLRELEAPARLLARVEHARQDEVRHARLTHALAAKHGAAVRAPVVSEVAERPDFAIENAVEGCVREAFGAVVAAFQAANAADPEVRAAFAGIAEDEARHAELSFAIDAWLMARLGSADRHAVALAVEEAWTALGAELSEPASEVRRVVGYPTLAEQRALLAALRDVALAA